MNGLVSENTILVSLLLSGIDTNLDIFNLEKSVRLFRTIEFLHLNFLYNKPLSVPLSTLFFAVGGWKLILGLETQVLKFLLNNHLSVL